MTLIQLFRTCKKFPTGRYKINKEMIVDIYPDIDRIKLKVYETDNLDFAQQTYCLTPQYADSIPRMYQSEMERQEGQMYARQRIESIVRHIQENELEPIQ